MGSIVTKELQMNPNLTGSGGRAGDGEMTIPFSIGAQLECARAISSNRPPFRVAQGSRPVKNGLDDACIAMADGLELG